MSTQFEPKEASSRNKTQYDSLAFQLKALYCFPDKDGLVSAQIKACEDAIFRIDVDWAAQKEP